MIRPATLDDVPAMVALGVDMVAESPAWSRFAYLPERTSGSVRSLIESEDGFAWVAERDRAVVGFLLAMAVPHWACDVETISELLLYIHPAHRGGTIAARLVVELVNWAESRSARPQLVSAGSSTGVNTDLTRRLYERLGFTAASIGLERVHV